MLFFLSTFSFLRYLGWFGSSSGKESACNARDLGLIPGLGRSPGGGHGNTLQYSCLENPIDRGAWGAIVHGVSKKSSIYVFSFTITATVVKLT